jgi:UDP-N-acetylmuramoyl-L-alanyl-D-glutamate--2,6-diaminopimelate ligase
MAAPMWPMPGAGAAACLVEQSGVEAFVFHGRPHGRIAWPQGRHRAHCRQWFDHPTSQLQVLAVTGTNGKTSTLVAAP